MNKNFASWELTQLLPNCVPNHLGYNWYYLVPRRLSPKFRGEEGYLPQPYREISTGKYSGLNYSSFQYEKQAWTWEDIRLYLQSKGYELEIITEIDDEGNQRLYYYNIHFLNTLDEEQDDTMYHSYEEAREAGLIYLLETYDK